MIYDMSKINELVYALFCGQPVFEADVTTELRDKLIQEGSLQMVLAPVPSLYNDSDSIKGLSENAWYVFLDILSMREYNHENSGNTVAVKELLHSGLVRRQFELSSALRRSLTEELAKIRALAQ